MKKRCHGESAFVTSVLCISSDQSKWVSDGTIATMVVYS